MLIEHNPKEAEDILDIIESLNNNYKLFHFTTILEALENLKNENVLPQLIILGSSQEENNNIEFLKNIKNDDNLKKIPVVILSSSEDQDLVSTSFNYGAAGYMIVSKDHLELGDLIKTIMRYWNMCELPYV